METVNEEKRTEHFPCIVYLDTKAKVDVIVIITLINLYPLHFI